MINPFFSFLLLISSNTLSSLVPLFLQRARLLRTENGARLSRESTTPQSTTLYARITPPSPSSSSPSSTSPSLYEHLLNLHLHPHHELSSPPIITFPCVFSFNHVLYCEHILLFLSICDKEPI